MKIKTILSLLLFVSVSVIMADQHSQKGIGLWSFPGAAKGLKNLKVSWFYNWQTKPSFKQEKGVEFVPMIWDKTMANST